MENLRSFLSQKYASALQKELVTKALENEAFCDELIPFLYDTDIRVIQNTAGVLSKIAMKKPALIEKHLEKMIQNIESPNCPVSIKRNVFRLFEFVKIEEKYQGRIIKLAFERILDKKEAIAVRAFAIGIVQKLSKNLPDLLQELKLILEDDALVNSAGLLHKRKSLFISHKKMS